MRRLSSDCVFESVSRVRVSSCRRPATRTDNSSAAAFSSEPLLERSEAQVVVSMSSSDWNSVVFSLVLLLLIVLFHSAESNIFFPVESIQESVHYRSLRDILFRSQTEAIAFPVDSSVIASFRPADPSPTLASPPTSGIGVSSIRFLESDAFFGPPLYHPGTTPEFVSSPASIHQTEGRRSNPALVARQPKSAAIDPATAAEPVEDERWPWPYSKPSSKQPVIPQSRQLQKLTSPLVVKKSVAKPYRLLTRTSSCPKLLHDLTITCSLPKQQSPSNNQPVEFQWYKTQHKSATSTANHLLDSAIKIPIAYGTQIIHKDARYGVSVLPDAAALTIRQLKPQDCGSYVCEALDVHNATILSTSEFLIFLCY